ncbi:MAG: CsbD family protein [Lachnospiraceae bacterium]|nr:CsbD family protein [Lachnospiraceae bacterium]
MSDVENKTDRIKGKINEATGKITGNEQQELKGKIQVSKADLEKKMNIKDKISDIKDDIAEKINDAIDKKEKK